ncbi:MAG TPA: tetratricopeptide repeat protein [Chloroflexi bacterium]|nr:tetratricopeptide repeat protein [Chloroflexota bacterium]
MAFRRDARHVHARPRRRRGIGFIPTLILGGSVGVLALAITLPLWLSSALRLIPDRYIAAYAPEPLQEIAFERNPQAQLPTAAPVGDEAARLLEELAPPTPSATGTAPPDSTTAESPAAHPADAPSATPPIIPTGENNSPAEETTPPDDDIYNGPPSYYLSGFTHVYQGWNNCGPATITMTMSYWGVQSTQDDAASFLKPNPEDRNVRPEEIAAYVESLGYQVIVRVDGDLNLLKRLLVAGFPVVIEKGFDPEPERLGWMGHYLLLTGFSDEEETFLTMDSYLGPNQITTYEETDTFWRQFNRLYIVPYRADQGELLASIIGEDMDEVTNYTNAILTAQAELSENPDDPFGWFNLGSSLVALGRYQEAATAFDRAREIGLPWRMLWYQFGPYEAYYNVGRYDDVIALADATVANNVYSEEAYYYEGLARAARGEIGDARYLFTLALRNNRNYQAAREALESLSE